MISMELMKVAVYILHHFFTAQGYHTVCHFHRNHSINPLPGHKWVTVAHLRCKIQAPAKWYTSP